MSTISPRPVSPVSRATPVVGRTHELATVMSLLDGVGGSGSALIIRGEPGAGKTTVLDAAVDRAAQAGMLTLRTLGVQSEAQMPFAGLHQLLRPIVGDVLRLPEAQRRALFSALQGAPGAPDVFLVALAALNLLVEAAARGPILLVADDVHWLDPPTADVLSFIARRLTSDPVVLLAAIRDGHSSRLDQMDLPELGLSPLPPQAAIALLESKAPDLEPTIKDSILTQAAGNPLALIELPVAWKELSAPAVCDWVPLTARLEQAFAACAFELPWSTRSILLVAAVNDQDSVAEALAAAERLHGAPVSLDDLAVAEELRLVRLESTRLAFRHPLVRSAVCQVAGISERMRAHTALAEELSGSPDRQIWHRAAGTVGEDDAIADELEITARRARRRGGPVVGLAALERAAQLTSRADRRGSRLLDAAEIAFQLGQHATVDRLLVGVVPSDLDELDRARLIWLREVRQETQGRGTISEFLAMADVAQRGGRPSLAVDAVLTAAHKAHWFNPSAEVRRAVADTAERLPLSHRDPRLLAALSLASPVEHGRRVIECLTGIAPSPEMDPEDLRLYGIALVTIPEYELAGTFLAAAVDGLRSQGRLTNLARALGSQASAALFRGDFRLSEQAAEEGIRMARESRQPRWESSCLTFLGAIFAIRGETDRAEGLVAQGEHLLGAVTSTPGIQHFRLARAAIAAADGKAEVTFDQMLAMFDPGHRAYAPLIAASGLIDFADAAAALGRAAEARAAVAPLAPALTQTGSGSLQSALLQFEAVLADGETTEESFRRALAPTAGLSTWSAARMRLAFGLWLRRQRRVTEARAPLRAAREGFDSLGAHPWAERARQELRASGETNRQRVPDSQDRLTAQELQIAQLAADGFTNREIGQRLFLSHRTVGTHLYKMFPKLGITSRFELGRVLGPEQQIAGSDLPVLGVRQT